MRINFIIDRMDNSAIRDVDCKGYNEVQEKDRCWLISSLHQVYSRRYTIALLISIVYYFIMVLPIFSAFK